MTGLLLIAFAVAAILICGLVFILMRPGVLLRLLQRRAEAALGAADYNAASPYAHFGFQPTFEEYSGAPLEIVGDLPADFEGAYLRNGANPQFAETKARRHAFNGAGMVHMVQIQGGEARYTNRFVRTERYLAEEAAGEELYSEFGTIAGGGKGGALSVLLDLMRQRFGVTPKLARLEDASATTSILHHHGALYCLQETARPFALDVEVRGGWLRFDGRGRWESFGGKLQAPFTAHPKVDPETGEILAFSTDARSGKVHALKVKDGKLTKFKHLYTAKPAIAFLHDCFLTETYAVLPEPSLRFAFKEFFGEHESAFYFDAEAPLRFGLMRRTKRKSLLPRPDADKIVWVEADAPGHIWHTVNAWEETRTDGGSDLVLIAPVFPDYPPDVPIHTPREPHATLTRFRIDAETGALTERRALSPEFYERPTINPRWLGKPQRYAYLIDEGREGYMGKGVVKYDLIEETPVAAFDYGDAYGGEALFVPRRGAAAEDDGYLVELLMREHSAELLILDAATMAEAARIPLPARVPFGVHACWLTPEDIAGLGR